MADHAYTLDSTRPFDQQDVVGHNRWHPDIPPIMSINPGETVRAESREWFDGHVKNTDSAEDILTVPFEKPHQLSGPFRIEGAKPGDLLVVDLIDVGPLSESDNPGELAGEGWGYTGIFASKHGGGFLHEFMPDAYKAIWDFKDGVATSRHIPGVSFASMCHPGLMGTAPSPDMLARWNKREASLIATDPHRFPPLAVPPQPKSATLGAVPEADISRISREAAVTVPPRENGGNMDIKNLTAGSRIFFPVFVDGANFSFGDLHFSQGDGEITLCGAIEMGGYVEFSVDIIPDGMNTYKSTGAPIFVPGDQGPKYTDWLTFTGLSITNEGEQRHLDATLAYQNAVKHCIDYLTVFGYSKEQAFLILGAAPIEAHFSAVVDYPNACATLYLPTEIFDFDVRPSTSSPYRLEGNLQAPFASASSLDNTEVVRAVPTGDNERMALVKKLAGSDAVLKGTAFGDWHRH
ncbi:formamidase [Corynebacterium sanguinis]|uniref:formamidase n=1 Tax=Corynebacterium sanguinis TaxID=2594913 RepID=UPI00223AFC79|nr:formamidase [Corynebacterium sanguinis]MCT1463754.1 acetamidase/formamidase family protein [Corynebacterium sanguinis]MCT1804410.1 acetamidase/formamidase family protein [Corynebacterium sanguinis]MCT2157769.1 acetamidase/formamidase family protein [Corynebacterium sanguinis]MCT2329638.1 acetamidase/formamidase family protein [Corynebacterium sanguinis]